MYTVRVMNSIESALRAALQADLVTDGALECSELRGTAIKRILEALLASYIRR